MAKSISPPPATRSRLELATERLEHLQEQAAALDTRGNELMAEHADLDGRLPGLALDAIEDEAKRDVLIAARARLRELPELIKATATEREALDPQIAEAKAALRLADMEDATVAVLAALDERTHLAAELDATLTKLNKAWSGYVEAGKALEQGLERIEVKIPFVTDFDETSLQTAVQVQSFQLAMALGQRPPQKLIVGDMRMVDDFKLWDRARPMTRSCNSQEIRGHLTALAGLSEAA